MLKISSDYIIIGKAVMLKSIIIIPYRVIKNLYWRDLNKCSNESCKKTEGVKDKDDRILVTG